LILTVLRDGRPCPDAQIHLGTPKDHDGKPLGKTDRNGVYRASTKDLHGRVLLLAEHSEKPPEGAPYDRSDYTAALHLDLP
jgi:hypothetical protein